MNRTTGVLTCGGRSGSPFDQLNGLLVNFPLTDCPLMFVVGQGHAKRIQSAKNQAQLIRP